MRVAVHILTQSRIVNVDKRYGEARPRGLTLYRFPCGNVAELRDYDTPAAGVYRRRTLDTPADVADWQMMQAPTVDPERPKLRDRIPLSGKKLNTAARKFCTLSPEFQGPGGLWDKPTNKKPIYPAASRGNSQSSPLPFESGRSTLPGMESFLHQEGIA